MIHTENDIPKYKKKTTSTKSDSNKRSDHKHRYKTVIIRSTGVGYYFSRMCPKCGRVAKGNHSRAVELLKPEEVHKPGVSFDFRDYLSIEEIRKKFPGIDIYEAKFDGKDLVYTKIEEKPS